MREASFSEQSSSIIASLQSRIQELEIELDSVKSSRNYYKDQCESLLLSLSNTVQKQTPTYRTQDEVEEMIEAIREQQAEKRRKLKEQLAEDRKSMEQTLSEMKQQIESRDKLLQEQEEARTSLIEKLMEYKRMLKDSQEKQQRTELTLSQLQSTNESLTHGNRELDMSRESKQIEELQITHANEIKVLKKHITKLTKKLKHATNSLLLYQSAQDESKADVTDLNSQIQMYQKREMELNQALDAEKKKQEDAAGLLKLACEEAKQFQEDANRNAQLVNEMLEEIKRKNIEIAKMNSAICDHMSELSKAKDAMEERRRENVELGLQLEDMKQQLQNEQDSKREDLENAEQQIRQLTITNEQLQNEIDELQNEAGSSQHMIQKLQNQVEQEVRLRKSAELARDNALTNLKNAYTLMNSSEAARHETSLELEKLQSELDERAMERETSAKQIKSQQLTIEQLKKELEDKKRQTGEFAESVEKERNNWIAMKKTVMAEATEKIRQSETQKEKIEQELSLLQSQYQSLVSENETRKETLEHQAETLATVQEEARHLSQINRKLRQKLRQCGVSAGDDGEIDECQSCKLLEDQIQALQAKVSSADAQLSSQKKVNAVANQNIDALFTKLKQVADDTHNSDLSEQALRAAREFDANTPLDQKIVPLTKLCMCVIDTLVMKGVSTSGATADTRLLRSTISHMGRRIEDLQARNKQQNDEIHELRNNVEAAFKSKDQFESQMESMSRSLFRSSIQSNKSTTRHVQSEVLAGRTESNSVLDLTDSDDELSVSGGKRSFAADDTRQAKVNALTDSLALLDLLCQ